MPQLQSALIQKICPSCGNGFMIKPYHSHRKYCCVACAYDSPDRVKKGPKTIPKNATCKSCGKSFTLTHASGKGWFCSQHCARSFNGKKSILRARAVYRPLTGKMVGCKACGKEFYKNPKSKQEFCCQKCAIPTIAKKSSSTMVSNGYYKSCKPFSRSKYGWCEVGGKRFFSRSSWERAYARHLQYLKDSFIIKDWSYEPETIKFPENEMLLFSYTPDFYVTTESGMEIHEVKGWLTVKGKAKLDLMARFFPDRKLIVIGRKWFEAKENKQWLDE